MAALETAWQTLIPEIKADIADIKGILTRRVEDHDRRITALERWRERALGGAAVIGAIVGFGLGFIKDWVKGR